MFLTQANVIHFLEERQFADLEAAVAGVFAVRSLTRRNLNFHVTCGAREYLVKQAKGWDVESRMSVDQEAAFYQRQQAAGKRLAALAPECYAYDPANSALVLEFLSGHTDLYAAPDRFARSLGSLCGEAMGVFHREMEQSGLASAFPGSIPWYLSLHEVTEEELVEASAGQRELARMVKTYAGFARALDRLRSEWQDDTLTHGDWKLENCLISSDRARLRVVDWEFVSWGDSMWDVSALLQSYWNFWVRWPSEYPIETIQPVLRAFLDAYAQSRGWEPAQFVGRAIRLAGARMLQSAFETLDKVEHVTGQAVRLMQGSLNILSRPDWAADQLIGAAACRTGAKCLPS